MGSVLINVFPYKDFLKQGFVVDISSKRRVFVHDTVMKRLSYSDSVQDIRMFFLMREQPMYRHMWTLKARKESNM